MLFETFYMPPILKLHQNFARHLCKFEDQLNTLKAFTCKGRIKKEKEYTVSTKEIL